MPNLTALLRCCQPESLAVQKQSPSSHREVESHTPPNRPRKMSAPNPSPNPNPERSLATPPPDEPLYFPLPIHSMNAASTYYPGCLIELSPALLRAVVEAIQPHQTISSINCTTGLFEAYLIQQHEHDYYADLRIVGWLIGPVDMPKPSCLEWRNVVRIKREAERRHHARVADALVFVCPGDLEEVRLRLEDFSSKGKPNFTVVWLGWFSVWSGSGFEMVLGEFAAKDDVSMSVVQGDGVGMGAGDVIVVIKKRTAS